MSAVQDEVVSQMCATYKAEELKKDNDGVVCMYGDEFMMEWRRESDVGAQSRRRNVGNRWTCSDHKSQDCEENLVLEIKTQDAGHHLQHRQNRP